MVDFVSSFQKGITAAQNAERNRKEIAEVFQDLNNQISGVSEGKIEIVLMKFQEASKESIAHAVVTALNARTYQAIAVKHKKEKSFRARSLAKWRQGPAGYPCWLTTSELEMACENRQALEQGLASILRSPEAGEAMYQAINFVPATTKSTLDF